MASYHKLWKVCTTMLLLLFTIQFTLMGFFKQKELLENKTANPEGLRNDRKILMVLVDALREDFIDYGEDKVTRLIDPDAPYAYHSQRFEVFKKYREMYPDRTFLQPAKSAMPTITVVRVKNFITGGISSLFETTSEFVQAEVFEDTILHQMRNGIEVGPEDKLYFYGDHCWEPYFYS